MHVIHSVGESKGFEEQEKVGAQNFADVARESGIKRIIYLGGMGNEQEELSPHLRSRHEVGRILRDSGVPTIEFRASIVLETGSLSFEMIRALTEHLPIMIMPRRILGVEANCLPVFSHASQPVPLEHVFTRTERDVRFGPTKRQARRLSKQKSLLWTAAHEVAPPHKQRLVLHLMVAIGTFTGRSKESGVEREAHKIQTGPKNRRMSGQVSRGVFGLLSFHLFE